VRSFASKGLSRSMIRSSVWSRSGGRRPFSVRSRSILVLSKPPALTLSKSASAERAQGLEELFLAEQFVDRPKYVLERYNVTMQSMNNRTQLRFSSPVNLFLWKLRAMQSGTCYT
jgi:hypothetical protein